MNLDVKSVTDWIVDLKLGDSVAATEIWDRFFERLCARLRTRLGPGARVVDEEDLALSAMHALYAGAKDGRFSRLGSRDDLWQILVLIGNRKAVSAHRAQSARKQLGESAIALPDEIAIGLDRVVAAEIDDGYLDDLGSACRDLLEGLEPEFRELALLKLQGHSNDEIMTATGRSRRTVERHLMIVREAWKRLGDE